MEFAEASSPRAGGIVRYSLVVSGNVLILGVFQ